MARFLDNATDYFYDKPICMKKIFKLYLILLSVQFHAQCSWNFTIVNVTGGNTITCTTPTLSFSCTQNNTNNVTSQWTGPSYTLNSYFANITQPGTYTLTLTDAVTSCSVQHSVIISSNTVAPSNTLSPSSMTTACGGGSPVSFTVTALSPTTGIQHNWYAPFNFYPAQKILMQQNNNTSDVLSGNYPPGIYTVQTIDPTNGCGSKQTFTISSTNAFPAYGIASPTSFSVGCAPFNQTTINIINPISTQTPPATCSYTFLPPTFTSVVTPSVIMGGNTSTVTSTPGTWTIIVEDNSNWCRTTVPVLITQNTVAPNVSVSMPSSTLTCNTPTIPAIGNSTTNNTYISWLVPANPSVVPSPSLAAGDPAYGLPPGGLNPLYANYTVVAVDSTNGCATRSVIPIYQNFKQPVSNPAISSPGFICDGFAQLVIGSSTVTSGVPGASVIPYLWEGPPPQYTLAGSPIYNAYSQGIYSLTVQDSYNGCLKTGTINVIDNSPLFTLQGTAPGSSVSCNGTVIISPTVNAGYTISVDMGTLTGTPQNTVTNLCYGTLHVCLTYTATGCKKCDSLVINGFTGIISNQLEKQLLIYPNPSQNSFMIKNLQRAAVKLFSAQGRLVMQQNIEGDESVDVSALAEGIYFAEISTDYGIVRKKLVIQR
jgi:hypothetical protein